MIFFELDEQGDAVRQPDQQCVTNDQFASIHEIVAEDWSRNYVVSELRDDDGEWYVQVTRMNDGDSTPDKTFNIDVDGTWEEV